MKKKSFYLRAVAFLATVMLLGGMSFQDSSAKTVRTSKTTKVNQMKGPDFAYPKTVEKNASASLATAVADGDWASAIRATIQAVTADNIISHDNAVKGLARIDSLAAAAPMEWRPAFMLIEADVYSSIYGSIRWRADSRRISLDSIPSNPYEWSREIFAGKVFDICNGLLETSQPDSRPLKEWEKFMENTADAYSMGMTVEEFICYRCFSLLNDYAEASHDIIPFFATGSKPVTPAQKCAALRDIAIDRFITSASDRRQSLLLAKALSDKADTLPFSLRMKFLVEAYQRTKGTEGEQLILSNFRDFFNEDPMPGMESPFPYSKKDYVAMLRKSVDDFPQGRFVNNVKNIINDLTRPFSEIRYENQYLTSSDISMSVKLTNCNESWVLVYDYSPFANASIQPKTREVAARCRLVKAAKISAEGEVPFSAEAKAEIGRLPKGTYVVIPSSSADGKGIYSNILNDSWREPFAVSDISVLTLQMPDAKTQVFVVDGSNGKPIEGAQVKVYTRKNYSSPRRLADVLTTDGNGSVTVSEERFDLEASYDGSKWSSVSRYYNSSFRPDTACRRQVRILADRAICHPGDSIEAVVIAYKSKGFDMELNCGDKFEISLRDTNGKEVAFESVITDSYGRAVVKFCIPQQGLLGNWQISASDGDKKWLASASIQVADYVAPTFFIASEHSEEDVNPGDVVRLKGQVMTYSGMPVAGAIVKYNVSYTPPMRWFSSGWATYDSSVTADSEGKYEIELPTSNLKGTQFERGVFTLQLSATSPVGETRQGPTERFALGKEFHINLADADRKMNVTDGVKDIICNVSDILGRRIKTDVSYQLIDYATGKTVEKGVFTSPSLKLAEKYYPSARYTLEVALVDDPDVKDSSIITLWRTTDKTAPVGTNMWTPELSITAGENEEYVDVTVGSGVPDRWIPAVLSADGEILWMKWLHIEKDNLTVKVKAPYGGAKNMLNLNYLSDLSTESCNVSILPASSKNRLKVATESFRDKVSSGDREQWSFRFYRNSGNVDDIPALAVMTDAALNAITPFNWNFSPQANRHPVFYNINNPFNSKRYFHTALKKITYLPYSVLSFPLVNDYGQGWGLNGGMYFDGGFEYASETTANGVAVVRSSVQLTSRKMAASDAVAVREPAAKMEVMAMDDDVVEMEEEEMVAGEGGASASGAGNTPELRETECPVAFFLPNLVSDKDGVVKIDFTVPNFNTTWAFQLLGYDRGLQTAGISLETVASKPIMVSTHAPRFVRTGDVIELTATAFNNSDSQCSPDCRFELIDLLSGKTIAGMDFPIEAIDVASSRILSMNWEVPSDVSAVGFRAFAEVDGHSDGEQALVPVLPASSPVVESTPFWIAPDGRRMEVKLPKFKVSDQVTLQYCDNPAWYCISALPDIVKPDSKSVTSKIKALFGNTVAFNLISSNPNLKTGLETLLSDKDSQFAALKSNLEKDGHLKITQLANTPWVNNAESETLRMSRLSSLLDESEAHKTIAEILDGIRTLQSKDGGWSWCPEMESSPYITRDVLRHFAMILRAGAGRCLENSEVMIRNGIKYVDSETVKDYRKYHKKGESLSYLLDWLYVRSSFPVSYISSGSIGSEMSSIAAKARKDIASEWKEMGIGAKAKAATVLWRAGEHKVANEILESLRQYASESPEKGMWFDNLNSGWGGMSTIQTTTLVLEAFSEIQPSNKIIDSLRQWLVLGRQYQDWGRNTYTVETVNAILTSGSDWNDAKESGMPEFSIKDKKLEIPAAAKLTGAFTISINARDASGKTLVISRNGASPAWGGVIAQYESPILEVRPAEIPELSIRKSIVALVEGGNGELTPKEGITLKKGMKVRVTLFITAGRDMDFVAVTDERSACLEPVDQLSGYTRSDGVGFYREVRDASTNLFFGWLSKGTHVVSYDCTVSQDGEFSCGIATAQSQYSPLIVAHSAGSLLKVN